MNDTFIEPALHEPAFHAGDPFPAFRRLRAEGGVHWHEPPGFWAATAHRDVTAISRDPATFCSSRGILLSDIDRPIMPRQSITYIDPPEHVKYRKLVQPAFAPGRIRALAGRMRDLACDLLDAIEPGAPIDFVEAVAAPLPLLVIADMLGVPGADRAQFKAWSDAIIDAGTDPTPENMERAGQLFAYFSSVLAERRAAPGDDLLSVLVQSEVDGERLEEFDLLAFCLTLLVAGNETTRNLVSGGALALMRNPAQRERLLADPGLLPNAVEEMLRYVSPVRSFARVAATDTEIRGKRIRAGEGVVLFYGSANRDEEVFGADSDAFDVTRESARRQIAFGFGEHLCLGASLARLEARVMFEELFARWPRFALAGEPAPLPSSLMNGLVRMPVVLEP